MFRTDRIRWFRAFPVIRPGLFFCWFSSDFTFLMTPTHPCYRQNLKSIIVSIRFFQCDVYWSDFGLSEFTLLSLGERLGELNSFFNRHVHIQKDVLYWESQIWKRFKIVLSYSGIVFLEDSKLCQVQKTSVLTLTLTVS